MKMKVRDLIAMEVDVDVYDDCCEACAIAFCGPLKMTNRGAKCWARQLDAEVEILPDNVTAIVHADDEESAKLIAGFFNAAAGYCAVTDYERWFDELD